MQEGSLACGERGHREILGLAVPRVTREIPGLRGGGKAGVRDWLGVGGQ